MTTKDKAARKSAVVANNKKAFHEYLVLETFKAGIVLTGRIQKGEVFLYGLQISPYEKGTHYNHQPDRVRKLLLTRKEINKLVGKTKESGLTLIPLKIYFDRCWVKVDLGLCKGKKLHDKREAITQRDTKREIERSMKTRLR